VFSQHGEDDLIATIVPASGRFLDIGAFHPKRLSNTRLLYERGWSGVMIEPSPGPMRRLIDEYGYDERITLVQALIGQSHGLKRVDVTDGPVSTENSAVRRLWATDGDYVGAVHIPMLTLDDIINQFGAFDFVNIDAEGGSVDIFARLLDTPMNPACVCVEHDGEESMVQRTARKAGYRIAAINETNMVVCR
jgi:FkbM family methyltransferase